MLTITELQEILPQEYPFLLIDKVVDIQEGKRIVAVKNVTVNEHFFEGHFPDFPIMPGVLILEAMAQASIVLYVKTKRVEKEKVRFYFAKADIKWLAPVVPGDQLVIEIEAQKMLSSGGIMNTKAKVLDQVVAEGTLGFGVKSIVGKK